MWNPVTDRIFFLRINTESPPLGGSYTPDPLRDSTSLEADEYLSVEFGHRRIYIPSGFNRYPISDRVLPSSFCFLKQQVRRAANFPLFTISARQCPAYISISGGC